MAAGGHEIKSFVFMDIETSGLPDEEFNRTKITEISFIACSKEHINDTDAEDVPRVKHKLTLCFDPRKMIQCGASAVTGKNVSHSCYRIDLISDYLNVMASFPFF